MTGRFEGRRGRGGSRDPERAAAVEGPSLPERLYEARERKGVDLYRAERETKIRARYLQALEHGEYRELPGAVYTKGFLRNYALYLGLDPEEVLQQWRRERGDHGMPAQPVIAVPQPLAAPRQGLLFSPVVVVAALLTVLIGAFVLYIGFQLVRFAKPPTITVTTPAQAVIDVPEETATYTLRGRSIPGATITITIAGREEPYRVSAGADGSWTKEVELRRGRNEFVIEALDPETGKTSEVATRIQINVPFLVVEAPTLDLSSPVEGSAFENGAIPVQGGTTNAATVTLTATYLAPPFEGAVEPGSGIEVGDVIGPVTVEVLADGSFESSLDLAAGSWEITTTATSDEGKSVTLARRVSVAYDGVIVVVAIRDARAWLKVWVDGVVSPVTGSSGTVYNPGKVLVFTADETVEIRTGKSNTTYFTVNGVDLGRLSTKGNPETWLFAPPDPPVKTERR